MTAATGYRVDTAGLGKHADTAHELSLRVAEYPKAMRRLQCPSEDLLGAHAGVASAYESFLNAWGEELGLTAKALEETSDELATSTAQYDQLEQDHAGAFDRAER